MTFKYHNYSARYPKLFENMKREILILSDRKLVIEHIGSTSVPGLGGKGIIDISIGIRQWSQATAALRALKKLGFKHFHTIENHSIFVSTKAKCEEGDFHVHISRIGTSRYRRTLRFRDYLRNHPDEVAKYANLKKQLFTDCKENRQQFKELKNKYFDELETSKGSHLLSV